MKPLVLTLLFVFLFFNNIANGTALASLGASDRSVKDTRQEIILTLNLNGEKKSARVLLFLPVDIKFEGDVGGSWKLDVNELNQETGQIVEYQSTNGCKLTGSAGIGQISAKTPTLPFVKIYRKSGKPLTLYFKIGHGFLDMYWSTSIEQWELTNKAKIVLSADWLKYCKEISPTSKHPKGGLRIEVPKMNDSTEWLEFFLDFQDDPNFETFANSPRLGTDLYFRRTDLIIAVEKGDTVTVQTLLTQGADVNEKSKDGWTALTIAAMKGHVAIVRMLLAAGADVNAKSPSGKTALMLTATIGHTATVQALLAAGADVNAKSPSGKTALMLATEISHTAIVKLLKEAGAKE